MSMEICKKWCKIGQTTLASVVGTDWLPDQSRTTLSGLDALLSPAVRGVSPDFFQEQKMVELAPQLNGVKKTIYVTYDEADCDKGIQQPCDPNDTSLCDGQEFESNPTCVPFEMNNCTVAKMKFTMKQLKSHCEQADGFISRKIENALAKALVGLNKQVLAEMYSRIGVTVTAPDGSYQSGTVGLPLMKKDGTPTNMGLSKLKKYLRWGKYGNFEPIIIGSGIWEDYMDAKRYRVTNRQGVDDSGVVTPNFQFYLEDNLDEIFGEKNCAFAIAPRALTFSNYYCNVNWVKEMNDFGPNDFNTVFTDSRGLTWDVFARTSNHCDENTHFNFTFKLRWGIFSVPDDATCYGNGIHKFKGLCTSGMYCLPNKGVQVLDEIQVA